MRADFTDLGEIRLAAGARARRLRHSRGADLVLLEQDAGERFFAFTFETGPGDDSGVAHVLEHLVFRGSAGQGVADLYADLVQAGPLTDINATTCADLTTFHGATGSEDGLAEMLEVIAGALFFPLLDGSDFAQERAVVQSEMAGHWAVPANAALAALRARLLGGVHSHDHGGRGADLASLDLARLRGFHGVSYRPERLRLFIAGPIDAAARLAQLRDVLDVALPPPPPPPPPAAAPTPRPLRHPGLAEGLALPGVGWRLPHAQALTGHLLRALAERAAQRGRLPPPLPVSALAHDGPESDLVLLFPPCEAAAAGRLAAEVVPALAAGREEIEAGIEELAALAADETPAESHRRLIGAWRHGLDPLGLIDAGPQVAELRRRLRAASRSGGGGGILPSLFDPRGRQVALALAGGGDPPTPDPPPPAPPERAAAPGRRYRTRPPRRVPALRVEGDLPLLSVAAPPGAPGRMVLALGLAGVSAGDLPGVALLARHLARGRALVAEVVPAPGPAPATPGWLLLRGIADAASARALAGSLAAALEARTPSDGALDRLIEGALAAMPPPHLLAALRLGAAVSPGGLVADRTAGLSLRAALTRDPPGTDRLDRLRGALCGTSRLAAIVQGAPGAAELLARIARPDTPPVAALRPEPPMQERHTVPGRLNTLGLGLRLTPSPLLALVAHALETGWLRDEVRRRGGAYGVRCIADPAGGGLIFLSARDPQRAATFERFRESPSWLTGALRGDTLARCIDGTAARMARPLPPGPALAEALRMRLAGETHEGLDAALERVLSADAAAVAAIAGEMSRAFDKAATVEFLGSG